MKNYVTYSLLLFNKISIPLPSGIGRCLFYRFWRLPIIENVSSLPGYYYSCTKDEDENN